MSAEGSPPAGRDRRDGRGRRVVVFACGEPARGDDAAALVAAERLLASAAGAIEVRSVGALEPEHLLELGDLPCVVADCVAGIAPGELVTYGLEELLPTSPGRPSGGPAIPSGGPAIPSGGPAIPSARSTHLLPLGDVLALVELIRPGLPRGRFVGIGGVDFGLGRPLSPEVERALPAFAEAIATAATVELGHTEGSSAPLDRARPSP